MENEREKDVIAGRNAVTEALKAGRPIDSIYVRRGDRTGSVNVILRLAKQAGVTVKEADPKKLDAMCGGENHQGVAAVAAVAVAWNPPLVLFILAAVAAGVVWNACAARKGGAA